MELEILGMNFGCVLRSLSEYRIPDKDCLLPLISKILGYCIVAASTTVKVPQICKILKHGSIRGLSIAAFELEVVGYTIALSYCLHKGLPFSAYGELAFLLIQAIILVVIIYYYSQPMSTKKFIPAALYCAVAPTILAGQINPILFEALYASQHAIFFCARLPQIWKNYTNKSTGELSFLTCFMNFGGSLVRVFTGIQENAPQSDSYMYSSSMIAGFYLFVSLQYGSFEGSFNVYKNCHGFWLISGCTQFQLPSLVILGSAIGIFLNGTILSQILLYQKSDTKKEKKQQ